MKKIFIYFFAVWLIAGVVASIGINDMLLSDEYEFIYAAEQAKDWQSFKETMTSNIGGEFYRPVLYFSFMIDYAIYGLNSWGYHLTNSILQAFNTLFVAMIVWVFGLLYYVKNENLEEKKKRVLQTAIISSLLFAVFPSHHEAVTWLAARTDLLATFWYLLTLIVWLYFLKKVFTHSDSETIATTKKVLLVVFTTLLAGLAFFTKEVSASLIILLLLLAVWHGAWYLKKDYKKWLWLVLSWLPTLLVFVSYILIRKNIINYWFGGYVIAGSSVFLNISMEAIIRFLKLPITLLVYTINYSYLKEFLQFREINFIDFSNIFDLIAYFSLLVFLGTVIYLACRKRIKKTVVLLVIPVLSLYIFASPMIGVLGTINMSLESTRFLYLPSVAMCIMLAMWLMIFKNFWKYLFSGLLLAGFLLLYIFNYLPWQLASDSSASIQKTIIENQQKISYDDYVYFFNMPDNLFGAFVFRRGLTQMFQLRAPNIDRKKIIISGRGLAGVFAPDCISTISEDFWLMDLDDSNGLVKSFQKQSISEAPNENIIFTDHKIELVDIKKLSDNQYEITGLRPEVIIKDINVDPKKIKNIELEIIPQNDYLLLQQHVYWATQDRPFYHEFNRHIRRYIDITIENKDSQKIDIPVCRYPAFVFSDTIKDIRINIPFKQGEIFILR